MAAFPCSELEAEKFAIETMSGVPGVLAPDIEHAPIITGENYESVVCNALLLECLHDLAHDPVEFVNEVTVGAALACPLETRCRRKRMMDICGGQIEKKWVLPTSLDPVDRLTRERRTHSFVVVQCMGRVCSTDLIHAHFFKKFSRLRLLSEDERVVSNEADDLVILDVNERWMAVDDGYAVVVIEAEFQRAGL